MANTNFTMEMLASLEAAIASGTRSVYYGDKRVEYQDLSAMIRARDLIRIELGLVDTKKKLVLPNHSKGL